jgi:hypothetical protein
LKILLAAFVIFSFIFCLAAERKVSVANKNSVSRAPAAAYGAEPQVLAGQSQTVVEYCVGKDPHEYVFGNPDFYLRCSDISKLFPSEESGSRIVLPHPLTASEILQMGQRGEEIPTCAKWDEVPWSNGGCGPEQKDGFRAFNEVSIDAERIRFCDEAEIILKTPDVEFLGINFSKWNREIKEDIRRDSSTINFRDPQSNQWLTYRPNDRYDIRRDCSCDIVDRLNRQDPLPKAGLERDEKALANKKIKTPANTPRTLGVPSMKITGGAQIRWQYQPPAPAQEIQDRAEAARCAGR